MQSRLVFFSLLVCAALGASAQGAELKGLASGATREAIEDVAPRFEQSTGHKLSITWTGSVDIRKRIGAGEVYDFIIGTGQDIDKFTKDGTVASGSRVDLMKSGVGVAVKEGSRKPDISSPEALKSALIGAKTIGYSSGPSGVYVEAMLKRMGIHDQVKPKLKQVPSGVAVGSIVVGGQADIGIQQISEVIHYPGVIYLGPLPPELQNITQFSAGVHSRAQEPEEAKAFIEFLITPDATDAIRRHGMEPG